MDQVFKHQIGRNVKVYMNDMVVKTYCMAQDVANLEEVFGEIHKFDMRLNPEKCTFKANPDKCMAILEMQSPTNVKEI